MLAAGDRAPDFELPDLEGRTRRLADALARGPVLAVFWKASCATCHLAFPYLQRLAEIYPSAGPQVLAVSQDAPDTARDFARQHGLTIPVLVDGEGWPVSQLYDPEATPTLFLIGRSGTIELTSIGFDKGELNEAARRLAEGLGEAPRVVAPEGDGNPAFKPG